MNSVENMPWLFPNKIFAVIYFFLIMKCLSTVLEMMTPLIEKKKKKNHHFMQFQIKCLRIECFQKSKNMLKRSKYHHWTISFQVYYLCTQHSLGLGNQCRGSLNWFFKVDWWCVFILCQTEHSWRPGYWTNPLPHEISNSLSEASTNKCAIWQQGYQMWQSSSDSHSHATVTSQFLDLFEAGAEK